MFSVHLNRRRTPASVASLVILVCASLLLASCKPAPRTPSATITPIIIVVTSTPSAPSATPGTPAPAVTGTVPSVQATITPGGPTPAAGKGLLFGPFHLPDTNFGPPFTGAFISLRPETAQATLDAARAAGLHLVVNMAGGRNTFQAAGGAFSVQNFQRQLDSYKNIDFGSYVADGTVLGTLMFDEPQDPSNWNGAAVPFTDIDSAAQYSKQLWPTLPVGVGGPPSFLASGAPYKYLDFAFAQYTTKLGDPSTWLKQEASAAQQAHLGLLLSINVLGGNNRDPVTAQQLTDWASLFLTQPSVCGLLMWKYDPTYFQSSDVQAALSSIGQAAGQKPARLCKP